MKVMKYSKTILLLMMILPWFSVPLLGKQTFKRFLPAGMFISLVVRLANYIAKKRKWWWWYETLHPKLSGVIPFMLGPFFVGSLWSLKWTYGNFLKYMLLSLAIDSAFVYGLYNMLHKLGIVSLIRMNQIQLMYVFTTEALLLYGFQYIKDKLSLKGLKLKV